ncbi:hypothetical protein DBV15_03223 [Temnothorax longispinosus]|uniref:Uncharacterized protein n=1 Tax=Temnothorax longispinosus TaxID=300112 RepID=A0A4S2LA23_9HYME|nr:hypothetical protein DBV15_03223 [Temnothorax longispinosus]
MYVRRTLIGRGLKRGTRFPCLPMEFPASSMLHDSFRRALQRGTRTRALVLGGLKQNVSSQATRREFDPGERLKSRHMHTPRVHSWIFEIIYLFY